MRCLECKTDLIQTPGKRAKQFCNSTCRSNYWQKAKRKSFEGIIPTIKEHEKKTGKPHNLYEPAKEAPNELKNEPPIELTGMALELWVKRQKFLKR